MHNKIELLNLVSLFILTIGVVIGKGTVIVIASVFALAFFIVDKERSNLKSKDNVKRFVLPVICFFITLLGLSFFKNNWLGVSEVLKYMERSIPAVIILALLKPRKYFFEVVLISILVGVYCVCYTGIIEYFTTGRRIGGIYGHPNDLGGFVIFMLPFLIVIAKRFLKELRWVTYAAILGIVVSFIVLLLTGSRGAMLAGIGQFMLITLYLLYKNNKRQYIFIVIIPTILCSLFVFGISRHYDSQRLYGWYAALEMFSNNPITGIGIKAFKGMYAENYINAKAWEALNHPHNIYLLYLTETGIIGFSTWMYMLYSHIKINLTKSIKDLKFENHSEILPLALVCAICGMLIHGCVDVCCNQKDLMRLYFYMVTIVFLCSGETGAIE